MKKRVSNPRFNLYIPSKRRAKTFIRHKRPSTNPPSLPVLIKGRYCTKEWVGVGAQDFWGGIREGVRGKFISRKFVRNWINANGLRCFFLIEFYVVLSYVPKWGEGGEVHCSLHRGKVAFRG